MANEVNLFSRDDLYLSDGTRVYKTSNNIADLASSMLQTFVNGQMNNSHTKLRTVVGPSRCLVGGDPEFFIEENKQTVPSYRWFNTNPNESINFCFGYLNKLIPAQKHLQGLDCMTNMQDNTGYYNSFVHPDGYQIELGYFPASCMEETTGIIANNIIAITNNLQKKNLLLSSKTSTTLTEEEANLLPLGCRPSFNAHFLDNTIYNHNPLMRFAGGHYHFSALGYINQTHLNYVDSGNYSIYNQQQLDEFNSHFSLLALNMEDRIAIVNPIIKALDASIGVLSVAIAGDLDDPQRRSHHYGMAGDYRLTKRTLEYRTPSNVTWQSPVTWNIMGMIGREIVKAYLYRNNNNLCRYFDNLPHYPEIVDIINNTDVVASRKYINKHFNNMLKHFTTSALNYYGYKILGIANKGFNSCFESNIMSNWGNKPAYLTTY